MPCSLPSRTLACLIAIAPVAIAAAADDLAVELDRGLATKSRVEYQAGGIRRDLTSEPVRWTVGWTHRFASEDAGGPFVGIGLTHQVGPSNYDYSPAFTLSDVDVVSSGVDVMAGYALVPRAHPRLRLSGGAFGGYFISEVDVATIFGDLRSTGHGWDLGLAAEASYRVSAHVEVGLDLRWLLLDDGRSTLFGEDLIIRTHGLLAGVSLGYRL